MIKMVGEEYDKGKPGTLSARHMSAWRVNNTTCS